MKAGGHTAKDVAKYLGVSRATLYRYLGDEARARELATFPPTRGELELVSFDYGMSPARSGILRVGPNNSGCGRYRRSTL